ncbi:hypothetical protein PanWU01x14_344230 [Parasponia andersonii]|uniref:Uncharacterized protein n=1 Tax=Parasponia andersonii TaxID=3476 RepID=A0A2P5AD59_PARAD|nr:hypothetical protein PanWU01x14_344230 [Parasponia andersonii]
MAADLKNDRTLGLTSPVDDPRKRAKRKLLCNKNLPADLKNDRTLGLTSPVNDPRKCAKRKLLGNKNLPADLKNDRTLGLTSPDVNRFGVYPLEVVQRQIKHERKNQD